MVDYRPSCLTGINISFKERRELWCSVGKGGSTWHVAVTWYAGFELQQRWDVVECSETLLRNRAGTYWHAAKRLLKIGPGRIGCNRKASFMSDLGPTGICGTLLLCRICALERREGSSPILQRMDRCNTGWEGWGKGVALRRATVHCPSYVHTHAPTPLYHSARVMIDPVLGNFVLKVVSGVLRVRDVVASVIQDSMC